MSARLASGALVWSSVNGLHFNGQADLKLTVPIQKTVGPVTLQALGIEIATAASQLAFHVTVTGAVQIGPIQAVVSDLGVTLRLTPVTAPA